MHEGGAHGGSGAVAEEHEGDGVVGLQQEAGDGRAVRGGGEGGFGYSVGGCHQAGSASLAALWVSCDRPVPSAFMT